MITTKQKQQYNKLYCKFINDTLFIESINDLYGINDVIPAKYIKHKMVKHVFINTKTQPNFYVGDLHANCCVKFRLNICKLFDIDINIFEATFFDIVPSEYELTLNNKRLFAFINNIKQ